jgi:transcriptional regulator with XRE-family HTH domain
MSNLTLTSSQRSQIKTQRQSLGMTQRQLAESAGIGGGGESDQLHSGRAMVARIETQDRPIRVSTLTRLCDALGLEIRLEIVTK